MDLKVSLIDGFLLPPCLLLAPLTAPTPAVTPAHHCISATIEGNTEALNHFSREIGIARHSLEPQASSRCQQRA